TKMIVANKVDSVYNFLEGLSKIMYKIYGIVMQFAAIGILGRVAPIIVEYGPAVLLSLLKVIIAVAIAGVIHAIVVYALAVKTFANMNPVKFFKGIAPAAVVAFSTASSAGTLPMTLKNTQENLGVSQK